MEVGCKLPGGGWWGGGGGGSYELSGLLVNVSSPENR